MLNGLFMKPRQIIELLLSTAIMSFIMSGTMLSFNFGFTSEMLERWFVVYPIAWMVAIPGILLTRKLVGLIMRTFGRLLSTS